MLIKVTVPTEYENEIERADGAEDGGVIAGPVWVHVSQICDVSALTDGHCRIGYPNGEGIICEESADEVAGLIGDAYAQYALMMASAASVNVRESRTPGFMRALHDAAMRGPLFGAR